MSHFELAMFQFNHSSVTEIFIKKVLKSREYKRLIAIAKPFLTQNIREFVSSGPGVIFHGKQPNGAKYSGQINLG